MLSWFTRKRRKTDQEPASGEGVAETLETGQEQEARPETPARSSADDRPQDRDAGPSAAPAASAPAAAEEPAGRRLFQRLKERLTKTRSTLVSRLDTLFLGKKVIDAELLDDLEEILITADLGVATSQAVLDQARERLRRGELQDPAALKNALREILRGYLLGANQGGQAWPASGPFVIMVVGVNGVGKTTTIGKLAYKFTRTGQKVLLVAADTFRAAASEQLQAWGNRIGVEVVAQQPGADPSSVVFDALDYARPRDFDVIIVDTAGRLHTKANLMEELKKIKRVMGKKLPGAPHETLLVIDATTGQNGVSQARLFHQAVGVSGIALTKLDGTAKGGIVVNICHEFQIPIRFIGIGEQMEDLRDFDPKEFVDALFASDQQ